MKKSMLLLVILLLTSSFLQAQTLGDVNQDSFCNIVDALLIAQVYIGITPQVFHVEYADVDANGAVNIVDSLLIAQLYVGIIDKLPGDNGEVGEKPKASFTISNVTPGLGQMVTFDASASVDPDGTIVNYEWDFKDGFTATGVIVTHSFNTIDDYNVKLTVTDNQGNQDDKKNRVFLGRPDGWTEKSHHKSADPDYELVFPDDEVIRIDITISSQNYRVMEDDISNFQMWSDFKPVYVPVDVSFNGKKWWNVGMRYKGQSTLNSAISSRVHKYPFRFNFDKYEDDHPELDDQSFYGFGEMTFCNNWNDDSFLREKICSEIFRNGGVPAAKSGFCRVYLNTGSGPVYWGLYTMVEDISDVFADTNFEDNDGNMYKPEGDGADWTNPFRQNAFIKKNNEDAADWSDVQAAHSALHANRSNAQAWRDNLNNSFNTTQFLRWLAINTGITNWDCYGTMAQNYYLYQDLADNGRIFWIPWDFNLSLQRSMFGQSLELSLSNVGSRWPLIRNLMDDSVFNQQYHQEMADAMNTCINASEINSRIDHFYNMIRPYVVGNEGEVQGYTFLQGGASAFDRAATELKSYISQRESTVRSYLQSKGY